MEGARASWREEMDLIKTCCLDIWNFSENKLKNISGASEKPIQYTVQIAIVFPLNVSAVVASCFPQCYFRFSICKGYGKVGNPWNLNCGPARLM